MFLSSSTHLFVAVFGFMASVFFMIPGIVVLVVEMLFFLVLVQFFHFMVSLGTVAFSKVSFHWNLEAKLISSIKIRFAVCESLLSNHKDLIITVLRLFLRSNKLNANLQLFYSDLKKNLKNSTRYLSEWSDKD